MIFKTLSRSESERLLRNARSGSLQPLDEVNRNLRENLEKLFGELGQTSGMDKYELDVRFGLKLYAFFGELGFTNRAASDAGFWRYLSVVVAPHIVEKRWPMTDEDHYWKKPSRIWLSSIWWYIHLSWQGSAEATEKLLLSGVFNTDTILNLVERTGRDGTNVDLYRTIMRFQGKVKDKSATVFRAVMKLNTATSEVVEPALCPGGIDSYVKSLYKELNCTVE